MLTNSKPGWHQTRKPPSEVTPLYEDTGLFKTAVRDMMLELIPQIRRNDRQDLIVRGFVDRKTEIDVFFAGRRAAEVGPLENQLKALMAYARKTASAEGSEAPNVTKIRLPVRVEGAWRRSRQRDDSGWETGSYHFVVSRWSLLDQKGNTVTFGEKPVLMSNGVG
jgi:hypothetical protein